MTRSLLFLTFPLLLVLSVSGMAQQNGTLNVTVQQIAEPGLPTPAPAVGAKVIVAHWRNDGMHPSLIQDQAGTTNQMGTCSISLPPGNYDIFVAASELAPAAFRREVKAGATVAVMAHLRPAPQHLQPVQ